MESNKSIVGCKSMHSAVLIILGAGSGLKFTLPVSSIIAMGSDEMRGYGWLWPSLHHALVFFVSEHALSGMEWLYMIPFLH